MAGIDQPRHRDQGVGDAADRIGHAVIVHAVVAALEHRMDEHHRRRARRPPPRTDRATGSSSTPPTPFGWVPIIAPVKPAAMRLAQHFGRARAVLQRHGGERNEPRLALGGLRQMRVDQPRPGRALLGRQFVAEHVEPAADDLAFDASARPSISAAPRMSLSGFATGRVGLPPAKAKPRLPPSSISRIEGKLAPRARMASSRLGGTRWAWQSMIMSASLAVCRVARRRSHR